MSEQKEKVSPETAIITFPLRMMKVYFIILFALNVVGIAATLYHHFWGAR